MTYFPHDLGPADPTLPANPAKSAQKRAETGPGFHPNPDNPLIGMEKQETTPSLSSIASFSDARDRFPSHVRGPYLERLADGRVVLAAEDWQEMVDTQQNALNGILGYRKEMGADAFNTALAKLFEEAEKPQDFQSRRTRTGVRKPGFLGSSAAVRRELAQIYRESYAAGPEAGAFYTRLTWMLDCLARAATTEQKLKQKAEKAGQSEG